jgi:hypothetical protein
MKQSKSLSDNSRVQAELNALRAEAPREEAVDRTVWAFERTQGVRPVPSRSRYVWRSAAVATTAGLAVVASLIVTSPKAEAAGLQKIAAAVRAQTIRHDRAYRPDKDGNMVLTNEDWVDGPRQSQVMFDEQGRKSTITYDGRLMYLDYPGSEPTIDEREPSKIPIEDVTAYLNIPGGKVLGHTAGFPETYTLGFSNMRFKLYINPQTQLPIARDVLDGRGFVVEHNDYDYPASVPESVFAIPRGAKGVSDYPLLRGVLAKRLQDPGETQQIGGVSVTLKAVIVGQHKIMALWTGGGKGEYIPSGNFWVEGVERPYMQARPGAFGVPLETVDKVKLEPEIMVGSRPLRGDAAWFKDTKVKAPFTINIAVWAEDRTKPVILKDGTRAGFHSRMVGRLRFVVKDSIHSADPDVLLWKPVFSGDSVAVSDK